jgi:DNA primase
MTTTFTAADQLHLTNLTKVFWPECGYTKRDLLDYYTGRRSCIAMSMALPARSSFGGFPGSARAG